MAETLGSLVDKLSIKNLRIWHLDEALQQDNGPKKEELESKRDLANKQRENLVGEINDFLIAALKGYLCAGFVRVCPPQVLKSFVCGLPLVANDAGAETQGATGLRCID